MPKEDKPTLSGLLERIHLAADASSESPEALKLIAADICESYIRKGSSILPETRVRDDESGHPVVAAKFKYEGQHKPSLPRTFDVLFFLAMLIMDWGGARFRYHSTRRGGKTHLSLRCEHPSNKARGYRIRLARIILDTPDGQRTPFDDHHSYRYRDLSLAAPDMTVMKPELGREAAIEMVTDLYAARRLDGIDVVGSAEFSVQLRLALLVATNYERRGQEA